MHQFPFVAYSFPEHSSARRRQHHRAWTPRSRRSLSGDTQDSDGSLDEKNEGRDPVRALDPSATQKAHQPASSHPPPTICAQHAEAANTFCYACSQKQTEQVLAGLADRVAGVEATVVTSMGRIAEMISEMGAAIHSPPADLKEHGPEAAVEIPAPHVDAATSTPTGWIRSPTSKKLPEGVVDIGSDSQPEDQSAQHAAPPRVAPMRPLHNVPTADGSHSVQNIGARQDVSPIVKAPAKRTSAVPRMRTVTSPKPAFRKPPPSEENTSSSESTETSPKATRQQVHACHKKRRDFVCASLTSDSVPAMQPRSRSAPLRYGTHCWVMHPALNDAVIGIARAGVNSRSRSHHTDLVHACEDGQQCILFKKLFRQDVPLLFPDDVLIGSKKTCDSVLWSSGKGERWVRWACKYLREKIDDDMLPRGV